MVDTQAHGVRSVVDRPGRKTVEEILNPLDGNGNKLHAAINTLEGRYVYLVEVEGPGGESSYSLSEQPCSEEDVEQIEMLEPLTTTPVHGTPYAIIGR